MNYCTLSLVQYLGRRLVIQTKIPADYLLGLLYLENHLKHHCWWAVSPVVKVSNHGRHVMSSIQVPLDPPLHVKSVEAETSSRWCGG
ncbi:hypothetical protein TNCV_4290621 [Trichonephila clavipes]|nr:hypothetical protein TNCV_4290621 [Trichonephila clavipes]